MSHQGIDGSGEDGIAYGFFMLIVFLLLGAFVYLCLGMLYNGVLDVANENIAENKTSEQTRSALEFNRNIAMYLPIIMLIGAFVWAMHRGIGGSGVTYQSFHTGFVIMILLCVVGFLMAFTGGLLIDSLYQNLDELGYIQGGDKISAVWGNIQGDTMFFFINAYFFLTFMCPILGVAIFFKNMVQETSGSQYYRTGY